MPRAVGRFKGVDRINLAAIAQPRRDWSERHRLNSNVVAARDSTGQPVEHGIGHHVVRQNHGDRGQNGELRDEIAAKAIDGADELDR